MAGVNTIHTKNQRRRALKKAKKLEKPQPSVPQNELEEPGDGETNIVEEKEVAIGKETTIPFDTSIPSINAFVPDDEDPLFKEFKNVLEKFNQRAQDNRPSQDFPILEVFDNEDDIPDEDDEVAVPTKSKKLRKAENKMTVAQLKQKVKKPDAVDPSDIDSLDPILLVAIKSHRNVVPVPLHWNVKREYLSSKRGIEKSAFSLPKFIADTGIGEMRDAALEKDAEKNLKQKQRERVQPKTGRLDIDYNKLHEAFFKFQTKPELTRFGEVYYEGKEFETNLRHLRPGELSEELKAALNMSPGFPPPWLINQQRHGPPRSYPALKIPGVNAPPPQGASWGLHPGGYGNPPVDPVTNKPLWGGDLIGVIQPNQHMGTPVDKALWGELQPRDEEEEEEESEEDSEEDDEDEEMQDEKDAVGAGLQTPGGFKSIAPIEITGIESVGPEFSLRKAKRGTETEEPRAAYRVLREQPVNAKGFFGSEKVYDLKGAATLDQPDSNIPKKRKVGDVDVSVDVDALERDDRLNKDEIARQYEATRQQQQSGTSWGRVDQDDLSQMIADESRKRLRKDEERKGSKR